MLRPSFIPEILVVLTFAAMFSLMALPCFQPPRAVFATLQMDGMCCSLITAPVVRKLEDVPGVLKAEPDFKSNEIRMTWSAYRTVSERDIWDAARRLPVDPISLSVDGRVVMTQQ